MNHKDSHSSADKFRKRSKDLIASIYLTLISIIQATIFGFFIYRIYPNVEDIIQPNFLDNIAYIFIILSLFLLIVAVWFEYMIGEIAFVWVPGLADSFIPFLFGIAEFLLIYSSTYFIHDIEKTSLWYFSFVAFCAIAIWAYSNMYSKAREDKENEVIFKAIKSKKFYRDFEIISYMFLFTMVIIFIVIGLVSLICLPTRNLNLLYSIIVLATIIGFLIRSYFYHKRISKEQ